MKFPRSASIAFLATLLVVAMSPAQPTVDRIEALVSTYHDYGLFNGSVLVADGGEPIYVQSFGDAVMEWDVPNTPDTRFRIGSTTKQFTAAIILDLVEEGALELQDTVAEHVPDYPGPEGERITIHQLLTHTSGLPSYTGFPEFQDLVRDPFEPDSFVAVFAGRELDFEPGSAWSYSNSGYFLLGVVIEHVTGRPYDEVLRERILEPLGLDDTDYDHHGEVTERMATGYVQTVTGHERAGYLDTSTPFSAGMMYSTVRDLFAWDQALYGLGPFEEEVTKELMFGEHAKGPEGGPFRNAHYGYGWLILPFPVGPDTVRVIQHGGSINGFTTGFWRVPEDRRTVVVMDNTQSSETDEITRDLMKILYGQPVEGPKRSIARLLHGVVETEGVEAAIRRYHAVEESSPDAFDFAESELNRLGYHYLGEGEVDTAIRIFRLNVEAYPEGYNTYDSLAEAYLEAGEREKAIAHYRTSLELNPANENARTTLRERLGVEIEEEAVEASRE